MRTPRARWDPAWKALIQQVFHPWLEYFFPEVAAQVCPLTPPRFLESELQKLTPRSMRGPGRVDRLVEVAFRNGLKGLFLIHIEIQSQRDLTFPLRLLYCYVALSLHYKQPITCLVLLADGDPNWKPTSAELAAPATRLAFEFGTCKLLERLPLVGSPQPGEPVLNHVVRAWWLAMQTAGDARGRLAGRITLFRALYQAAADAGCDSEQAAASLRFLDAVAGLPAPLEETFEREKNKIMVMEDLDVITYSERKAFKKGRLEGRQEGRLDTLRETAIRLTAEGLDLPSIARALGVAEAEVSTWLQAQPGA